MKMHGNKRSIHVFITLIVLLTSVRSDPGDIHGWQRKQLEIFPTFPKELKAVSSDPSGGSPEACLDLEHGRSHEDAAPPQERQHQQLGIHTNCVGIDHGHVESFIGNVNISHLEARESIIEQPRSTSTPIASETTPVVSDAHGDTSTQRSGSRFHSSVETSSEAGASRIHSGNWYIDIDGADTREIREQQQLRFHIEGLLRPILTLGNNQNLLEIREQEQLRFHIEGIPRLILTLGNNQNLLDGSGENRHMNRGFGLLMAGAQLEGIRRADFDRERLLPISCYIAVAVAILIISIFLLRGKSPSDGQRDVMLAVGIFLCFLANFVIKPFI